MRTGHGRQKAPTAALWLLHKDRHSISPLDCVVMFLLHLQHLRPNFTAPGKLQGDGNPFLTRLAASKIRRALGRGRAPDRMNWGVLGGEGYGSRPQKRTRPPNSLFSHGRARTARPPSEV